MKLKSSSLQPFLTYIFNKINYALLEEPNSRILPITVSLIAAVPILNIYVDHINQVLLPMFHESLLFVKFDFLYLR